MPQVCMPHGSPRPSLQPLMLYCEGSHTFATRSGLMGNRPMPKLKTHKGAAKRFKKTGTGKVKRRHAFARHILTSKARSRKRKLSKADVVDPANHPEFQRMLPY
jgi:large subunit ribosomal protein L35